MDEENTPENYPMQTLLRSIVILPDTSMRKSLTVAAVKELAHISERTVKSAQIFIGARPILVLYPYLVNGNGARQPEMPTHSRPATAPGRGAT